MDDKEVVLPSTGRYGGRASHGRIKLMEINEPVSPPQLGKKPDDKTFAIAEQIFISAIAGLMCSNYSRTVDEGLIEKFSKDAMKAAEGFYKHNPIPTTRQRIPHAGL
jgi:hypothetical protein